MENLYETSQIKILEKQIAGTLLSFTDVGYLLGKKSSVISQYAKAGIVTFIQQGPKKVISLKDAYLLKACVYAMEHYGFSYTGCKLLKGLLEELKVEPALYIDYLKTIEYKTKITQDEVSKYVNSYKNRGIFQKQKNQKSEKSI